MILKILLVLAVIAIVYFLFFKKSAPLKTPNESKKGTDGSNDDTMVPCETCGVFVSVKEAYMKDGRYYCSKSCMEGK